jgi:hypothetical protein
MIFTPRRGDGAKSPRYDHWAVATGLNLVLEKGTDQESA